MMKEAFLQSLSKYTTDSNLQLSLWAEVEKRYSRPDRHYHTLVHLNAMLNELRNYQEDFANWDTIVFAIAYHDLVYSSLKNNNEERSAEIAAKRLSGISCPEELIAFCRQLILATKKHAPADKETNLFTDADLAILGSDPESYKDYSAQIRREYSIYPDLVYNAGRKKVLIHFLEMKSIYKMKVFADKYELAAKENIQAELTRLTNGKV